VTDLQRLVASFAWGRVLVVGDVMLDEWLQGSCARIAREAPVPTVAIRYRDAAPGGAGNTAVNVASLGGQVRLVSAVGDDAVSAELLGNLQRRGVEPSVVRMPGRRSMAKRRVVAAGQVVARFDEGDAGAVPEPVDTDLAERVQALAQSCDAVVAADYGLGTVTGRAVREALAQIAERLPVVVDAHDLRPWRTVAPMVTTPNWTETAALLELDPDLTGQARITQVDASRERLLSAAGSKHVIATLDGDGAVLVTAEGVRHIPTRRVADEHSAGAGDTFAAALALALAVGAQMPQAAHVAVAAATVVVQRPGTATCSGRDLVAGLDSALLTPEELVHTCREHRHAGRTIAFTNGCFDVLHAGHVASLRAAAGVADVVVVALDSDAGVRAIKGPGRPVNRLADRAAVLAALDTVDHVVSFDGPAPLSLIEMIRPDVYVKGEDHDISMLPEAQAVTRLGGSLHRVPLLPDRSTTGVIAACAAAQGRPA
jgi:D-beta-D-heptose 7-phosphate kinase/D-beta-D-heptose 1-phosphate adenosyltransferase